MLYEICAVCRNCHKPTLFKIEQEATALPATSNNRFFEADLVITQWFKIKGVITAKDLLPRLELPFEHCDPVAQLDGFDFRVHGGGETGKTREHRAFVCIDIGAYGMRAIE